MNVHAWLQSELTATGRTACDFFNECWVKTYQSQCRSNQVVLDANRYRTARVIPTYVWSVYDRIQQSLRTIPSRAVRASRWGHQFNLREQLVCEQGPVLFARRGADGVYRV